MVFLFRENRRHGTDGPTDRPLWEGVPLNNWRRHFSALACTVDSIGTRHQYGAYRCSRWDELV